MHVEERMESSKRFKSIRETATQFGVAEFRLRQWVKQGRIAGLRCGNRFLVDTFSFQDWLDRESRQQVAQ